MQTTTLGLLLGALLLAIPIYIIYALKLRRMRRFLTSMALMAVTVAAWGGVLALLMRWQSTVATVAVGLALAVAGGMLSLRRAHLRMGRLLLPVLAGMVVAVFVVGLYALFLVVGADNPLAARYFVPLFGLLLGHVVGMNASGLHAYYMGLLHHHRLYDYLMGNGHTHREATAYFVRRAFQAALNPAMKQMAGLVGGQAPVVLLALVMGGVGVGTAVALQIMLWAMVVAVSMASLFITLWVGRRYSFDEYERLRPIAPRPATAAPQAPAEGISASPSAPRHIDSGSLPPAE